MSDSQQHPYVIIGGGLAAGKAAETLRAEGYRGGITVISAEQHRPYERPPLSKGVLSGADPLDGVYLQPRQWYDDNQVELRLGTRALAVDPETRTIVLDDDTDQRYNKLLLATGSRARRLNMLGSSLGNVHYLRTADESTALRAALEGGDRKVVLIGAGWIGLEVAAAARGFGNEVTVIDPNPVPLYRALGLELGGVFADLHTQHGVTLLMQRHVLRLEGDAGEVRAVITDDDERIDADIVIAGIGTVPAAELAEDAGLAVGDGIIVDRSLRTSDEHIYAAGDVARWPHPLLGRELRVEHWHNALEQGPAAAKAMLGQDVTYSALPYFYTDQYDLGMEFVGDLSGDLVQGRYDAVTYRGNVEDREFIAVWSCGGTVVAGMNVNVWDVQPHLEALVRSPLPVDLAELADLSVPLETIASRHTEAVTA